MFVQIWIYTLCKELSYPSFFQSWYYKILLHCLAFSICPWWLPCNLQIIKPTSRYMCTVDFYRKKLSNLSKQTTLWHRKESIGIFIYLVKNWHRRIYISFFVKKIPCFLKSYIREMHVIMNSFRKKWSAWKEIREEVVFKPTIGWRKLQMKTDIDF